MLDAAALAVAAQARHPGMSVSYLPLSVEPGKTLRLRVFWKEPRRRPTGTSFSSIPTPGLNWAIAAGAISRRNRQSAADDLPPA
jgi:hypothetical protein